MIYWNLRAINWSSWISLQHGVDRAEGLLPYLRNFAKHMLMYAFVK
ncbi:unnamed protein product [Staurois parvus]|uniref:Uncharacterized protein n=1 Tax=Staurois parvus TaxID=386267 RepID=A0ABN9FAZ6_9NEOB|nr:unnamed protein product [Staurois parvus]